MNHFRIDFMCLTDSCTLYQCRLPNAIPREQKLAYARSLLVVLGLEKQADMVIGTNAQDGISADQRKRVTMGVEMAADPAILFLDEVIVHLLFAFLISVLIVNSANFRIGLIRRRTCDESRAEHCCARHSGGLHHPSAFGYHLRHVYSSASP